MIESWSLHDLATSWDRAEPQSGSGSYLEETYANFWTSRFSGGKDYIIQAETCIKAKLVTDDEDEIITIL